MKVDYDSEADALSIDLRVVHRWEGGDSVDDDGQCNVSFSEGRVANVELLLPSRHLDLLPVAAERFDLDAQALLAAAQAGLAAPDRQVVIYVGRQLPGSS
jgi:uncharacterized protein YuzE